MKKIYFSLLSAVLFFGVLSFFVAYGVFGSRIGIGRVAGEQSPIKVAYEMPNSDSMTLPSYEEPDEEDSVSLPPYEEPENDSASLPSYEEPDSNSASLPSYEEPDGEDQSLPSYSTPSATAEGDVVSSSTDSSSDKSSEKADDASSDSSSGASSTSGSDSSTSMTPPSVPGGVSVEVIEPLIARFRWSASTGGSGTLRYAVYRNGKYVSTVSGRYYDDHSIESGARYAYSVEAVDALKNVSRRSAEVSIAIPESVISPERKTPDSDTSVVMTVNQTPAPEKVFVDSDGDGLSDAEEERLGTDPQIADTDGDGFPDGEEVESGFNPLQYSPGDKSDKIEFESPKEGGEENRREREDDRYAVEGVVLKVSEKTGKIVTELSGTGLPNSYLTLYIYSDPIVVAVRTDANGNWRYELDRDLENGDHEVYVAVTDNLGRITAQSKPLPFTKTAEAVTIRDEAFPIRAAAEDSRSPLGQSFSNFVSFAAALAIVFIAVLVYIILRKYPQSS